MGKKTIFKKKSWGEKKKHVSKKSGKDWKEKKHYVHKKKVRMEKKKSWGEKKTLWSKKLGRIEKKKNIVQIKNTDKENINI